MKGDVLTKTVAFLAARYPLTNFAILPLTTPSFRMTRFILGDELGNIKILRCSPHSNDSKTSVSTIYYREPSEGVNRGVQQIASIDNENTTIVCYIYIQFNHREA